MTKGHVLRIPCSVMSEICLKKTLDICHRSPPCCHVLMFQENAFFSRARPIILCSQMPAYWEGGGRECQQIGVGWAGNGNLVRTTDREWNAQGGGRLSHHLPVEGQAMELLWQGLNLGDYICRPMSPLTTRQQPVCLGAETCTFKITTVLQYRNR